MVYDGATCIHDGTMTSMLACPSRYKMFWFLYNLLKNLRSNSECLFLTRMPYNILVGFKLVILILTVCWSQNNWAHHHRNGGRDYHPGTVSCGQGSATLLRNGHPQMKFMDAWSSYQLQWLDSKIGHQVNGLRNDCQGDMPCCWGSIYRDIQCPSAWYSYWMMNDETWSMG